jgi:hypothetical protein
MACTDPTKMLEFLRGKVSDRKLRLFTCACCRRLWDWFTNDRSRQAIIVAEQFADAERDTDLAGYLRLRQEVMRAWKAAGSSSALLIGDPLRWAIEYVAWAATKVTQPDRQASERKAQVGLLRDVCGNPFRPSPPLPASILAWNDRTVPRLAQGIYDERRMPEGTLDTARLAVLTDALLDAGCDDEALIQHCREPGPHVRGCWAVDLILGKG